MENKNTGGPAFAAVAGTPQDGYLQEGITKLDYFAAKAMQAILSNPYVNQRTGPICEAGSDNIAKWSYEQAHEMLKESEKYE